MNPDSPSRKKPQRLKERLREVTASAILDAAQEVLTQHGLQAPMELIASRAGVAVGTLYNHFSDRKTLIEELLQLHREQLREDVLAAEEENADKPVREQFEAMLNAMMSAWSHIFLVIKQGEAMPDQKKRAVMRARIHETFGDVLARGRKEGLIAPDPDGVQGIALQGLLQSLFAYSVDEPKKLSQARAVEVVADFFFHGVAQKKGK